MGPLGHHMDIIAVRDINVVLVSHARSTVPSTGNLRQGPSLRLARVAHLRLSRELGRVSSHFVRAAAVLAVMGALLWHKRLALFPLVIKWLERGNGAADDDEKQLRTMGRNG